MQLELISIQYPEPDFVLADWNTGCYDNPLHYFWDYATGGAGVDQFMFGTMTTTFFVTPDDVKLFPDLGRYSQVMIWEDTEEGVKMFKVRPEGRCFICGDKLLDHSHDERGWIKCLGLL